MKDLTNPIVANVYRDEVPESFHTGIWALSNPNGKILWSGGDIDRPIFFRSSIKLFQSLPIIESGAADEFGLTDSELTVITASHNSEDIHVETIRRILEKGGLDESYLQCGTHPLFYKEIQDSLLLRKIPLTDIYHNCSGKHTGILLLSKFIGADLKTYKEPNHPAQILLKNAVARMVRKDPSSIKVGIDGCDIPAFLLSTRTMALGAARWACPEQIEEKSLSDAVIRLTKAIIANPYLLAGKKRFCTFLAKEAKGKAVGKVGSEAGYAVAFIASKLGFACKVNDGAYRALYPFVGNVCKKMGVFEDTPRDELLKYLRPNIYNESNRLVGYIEVPEDLFENFPGERL